MTTITKKYEGAFVIDESKITRLSSVINERLPKLAKISENYDVYLSSQRVVKTEQLRDVLNLDNTRKNQINRLVATYIVRDGESGEDPANIEIDFDGRPAADIAIRVSAQDSRWVHETLSAIEEQVERAVQHGVMYQLNPRDSGRSFALLAMAFSLMIASVGASFSHSAISVSADKMWLNETDLTELELKLAHGPGLTTDDLENIRTRQLTNVLDDSRSRHYDLAKWWNWRLLLVLLPVAIILVACNNDIGIDLACDGALEAHHHMDLLQPSRRIHVDTSFTVTGH